MARTGEQVIAVITSQSSENLTATGAQAQRQAALIDLKTHLLDDARFVADVLVNEGFDLLNFHPLATTFAGSPDRFERVFGFRPVSRSFPGGRGRQVDGFDVEPKDADRLTDLPSIFQGRAGWLAIARPPRLIDDAGIPVRDVSALDCQTWLLPDELAMSVWADGAGSPVATGHGVVAAQIGTGHYRHRFFSERGYRVLPTLLGPGQQRPQQDDHGHSTGEAACLFAAAPDLRLRPVKGLQDPIGDLLMTAESTPMPDLIINSWGYDTDRSGWRDLEIADRNLHHYLKIMEAVIAYLSARGVVICASASRAWKSFPACHPDVLAIAAMSGGRAAQQTSRGVGQSGLYPDRSIPDLWSDAASSVRAGCDLASGTQPVQPGSALAQPGLCGTAADEGFAWCDVEQMACPLACSRLVLLLEQHRDASSKAVRAMVVEAPMVDAAGYGNAAKPGAVGISGLEHTADTLPQLTGERSA